MSETKKCDQKKVEQSCWGGHFACDFWSFLSQDFGDGWGICWSVDPSNILIIFFSPSTPTLSSFRLVKRRDQQWAISAVDKLYCRHQNRHLKTLFSFAKPYPFVAEIILRCFFFQLKVFERFDLFQVSHKHVPPTKKWPHIHSLKKITTTKKSYSWITNFKLDDTCNYDQLCVLLKWHHNRNVKSLSLWRFSWKREMRHVKWR